MTGFLSDIITSTDPVARDQALDARCRPAPAEALLAECAALDAFRRQSDNLYERVRALFFLHAIYRFHLPGKLTQPTGPGNGLIPFPGVQLLLNRRFEEAIDHFLAVQQSGGPSDGLASALSAAYQRLGFQTLADQVRRSVRLVKGNQWMFRMGHPGDHPLRIRPELLAMAEDGTFPVLRERTPVRMDLSHSGWSDIFFLGMDYPEGARVLNISVDLGIHGSDTSPRPPVEAYLRVIDEPILRLTSVDLGATTDIDNLAEVFDFARDYLGLLKAAIIAAGIVPPGIEGSGTNLERSAGADCRTRPRPRTDQQCQPNPEGIAAGGLDHLVGCARDDLHARYRADDIAVRRSHRRRAASRPGAWAARGVAGRIGRRLAGLGWRLARNEADLPVSLPAAGDPEFGISRGRLMPTHHILDLDDAPAETRRRLQESLVLVHGGMAQNVGPILEMVTEKYLLRSETEWNARLETKAILDGIIAALRSGDIRRIGDLTTRNFFEPDSGDHSLGQQSLHRDDHRARASGIRRDVLGILDARRHVGRRHGLHVRT